MLRTVSWLLPSRRPQEQEGGKTCVQCKWWWQCKRWWCPESPSTRVIAARDPFFFDSHLLPRFHLSDLWRSHASLGNACRRGSSSHCLEQEEAKISLVQTILTLTARMCVGRNSAQLNSYRMDTGGWTRLRCCIRRGRTCHYSDTCRIHQSRPEPVSEMENLHQGQDE